jgi:hypothetical protein
VCYTGGARGSALEWLAPLTWEDGGVPTRICCWRRTGSAPGGRRMVLAVVERRHSFWYLTRRGTTRPTDGPFLLFLCRIERL